MKTLRKILPLVLLSLLAIPQLVQAQGNIACTAGVSPVCLTQTTLAADQGAGPTPFAGTTTNFTSSVSLASTTGLIAAGVPQFIQSVIYIDNEAEAVISFNSATKVAVVQRGYEGTPVQPHVNGNMVLIGPPGAFNLQDPTNGEGTKSQPGACVAANTAFTPYINIVTGEQWLCSTVTKMWVPGWNNTTSPGAATTNVASAAGAITPSGPFFTITGAAAVTGFNIPVGFNATAFGGGCFQVRADPASTATWTAAGNISIAGTFTANKLFTFCWDAVTSKFVPSAVS